MEPVVAAVGLGFVLGLQHATDPDHLVAVATIVTRERRLAAGAFIGVAWGIGHMLSLGLAGGVMIALGVGVPPAFATALELAVAAMLIALGAWRLGDALRDLGGGAPASADHDHGGRAALHRHPQLHVHPARAMAAALGATGPGVYARALAIGVVHGLAGSAAIALLVLATLRSARSAALYLAVFGLGTIAGMTALTAMMALPVALALRVGRLRAALGVGAGLGSMAFGLWYGVRAF